MSHSIHQSRYRHPAAKRRQALYASSGRRRHSGNLPPNLLGKTSGRRKKVDSRARNLLAVAAGIAAILTVVGIILFAVSTAVAVGGTVEAYRRVNADLPSAAAVTTDTFQTTRIFDRNGKLLHEVEPEGGGWRTFITVDQMSQYIIDATIASEDATFWSHQGIEPMAIARGVMINVTGSGSSGGSTITQQLVRGLYPEQIGYELSVTRKFKEALAAVELDRSFSKQDILTMYLNQIFYGQRSYGIEAASQTYFQKHASELNLAEASMLAGLPQAPSFFDPTINLDQAKKRQRYVLDQMVKFNYVTAAEADEAWLVPLQPQQRESQILAAPHFTLYVEEYLRELYGDDAFYEGGLQVTTSIDADLQATAEGIVAENIPNLSAYRRNNASMMVMLPWSGEILAMVGSADFNDPSIGGQNNYALANLQPGSSIKPVIYAAAFESGWNPGTVVMDITMKEPTPGAPEPFYEPNNYTGRFYGAVPVRVALANSLNIPAVKAAKFAGVEHAYELGRRMGVKQGYPDPWNNYGLSFALGTGLVSLLEHTNVYGTLANNGKYVPAAPILKITDSSGNVLFDLKREQALARAEQVLKAEYAYQITDILTDAEAREMVFGRGNLFEETQDLLGRPTVAKSGTTDGWKDIWTMGYTSDLVVGVWVGQTSATGAAEIELPQLDGIQGAGPIWQSMMLEMHNNPQWSSLLLGPNGQVVPEEFPKPAGLNENAICAATGHVDTGDFESREELLVTGSGPALSCSTLSVYESRELDAALKDLSENGDKYVSRGFESIYRYADAAGYQIGNRVEFETPEDEFSGDSPPIEESQ